MRSPLLRAAGATLGTLLTIGGITLGVSNVAMIAVRAGVKQRKVSRQGSSATLRGRCLHKDGGNEGIHRMDVADLLRPDTLA